MKSMSRVVRVAWAILLCMSLWGTAHADVMDGRPGFNKATSRGLYVWREVSGSWQVRLLGGSSTNQFSGLFSSGSDITGVLPIALEANDQWSKPDLRSLRMSFHVIKGNLDGVTFATGQTSLCLRSEDGDTTTVYLGKMAVPASTPVDLTGNGACLESKLRVADRKFNTGHYISLLRTNDSALYMSQSLYPGVKGFLKRYTWRELEPTEGNYNFSQIAADLEYVASVGLQLVVQIEDKTFVKEMPLPDYLKTFALVQTWGEGGYVAKRWDPVVVARMKALTSAIGQQFDTHPAFEGIAFQESALSLSGAMLDATGYTPEKYRDALIDELSTAAQSMPHSRIFWFMNFLERGQAYIADIANAVKTAGVVMGGPDIQPDTVALQRHTYPFYSQFSGQMPLFAQIEPSCYRHEHTDTSYPTRYWTMPELFAYGRDFLHVNYLFWVRVPKSEYPDSYNVSHALPVIEQNPVFNQ